MNLTHLRAFDALARTGSVTAAARALRVTPAAVSLHVRQLERACGIALVERVRRRSHLNAAGRALQDYSRRIFTLAEEADVAVVLMRDLRAGALRLSATDTPARSWVPRALAAFRARYPGVRVQLYVGNTHHVVERLLSRDDDVAIIAGAASHPHLVAERLADDPLVVIVPPGHPWRGRDAVSLNDLRTQTLIVREPGSSTRQLLEAEFTRKLLRLDVAMELGSHDAIIGAVEHGVGVSILPRSLVERDVERGAVRALRVRGARLRRTVSAVYVAERAGFPLTQRFLEIARSLRVNRRGLTRRRPSMDDARRADDHRPRSRARVATVSRARG